MGSGGGDGSDRSIPPSATLNWEVGSLGIQKVDVIHSIDSEKLEAMLRALADNVESLKKNAVPADLERRLSEHDAKLAEQERRIAELEAGNQALVDRMNELEKTNAALNESIDGLKRTVEPLAGLDVEQMNELASTVVPGLDSRVQALEDSRATNERIDGLERRVEDAESEAAAAKEGASDAATKAKFAIDKTRALEQYIDQLWKAIEALERGEAVEMPPELDKSNSDPAVGMAEFDALRELVNALTSRTDTNESNLADLAAKIAGLGPSGAELSPEALQDMLDRIAGAEAKIESLSETKADRDEVPAVVTTDGAAPDPRIAAMVAAHAKRLDAIEKAAKELGDAVAAAASKEEVDDVRLGVLQTAYALLLLAVGPRADSHTKRPPSRTSSRTTGGADGKAEGGAGAPGSGLPTGRARPASAVPPRAEDGASGGGAGQARTGDGGEGETPRGGSEAQDKTGETREGADGGGPLGADVAGKPGEPAEVLDVLEGLLDKGMVREKGDKAALRRLAEWVDDNTLLKDSGTDWSSLAKKIQDDLAKLRRQVKMLSQQVKLGAETGGKADGDQAILSSKPLLGLRCMSCDRPLEDVQEAAGPHVPLNAFPVRATDPASFKSKGGNRDSSPNSSPGRSRPESPAKRPMSSGPIRATSPTTVRDPSPSNWYAETHGPSADKQPPRQVGPQLPPGGWRATGEQVVADRLPVVSRGPSRAGLSSARSRQGVQSARPRSSRLLREGGQ